MVIKDNIMDNQEREMLKKEIKEVLDKCEMILAKNSLHQMQKNDVICAFADRLVDLICLCNVSTIPTQTVIRLIYDLKQDMLEGSEQ